MGYALGGDILSAILGVVTQHPWVPASETEATSIPDVSSPAQGEQALGPLGLLVFGNGRVRSGYSPVGAAGSVSVTSGEVRLIYTLHIGL